ncbi:hypothetical protein BWI17_15055 [Betaproteobacteria bacterium GR16-43]|nr:hypothetical protein BWI17_15055 [Betaproteobacteria bacterium GR16-43]
MPTDRVQRVSYVLAALTLVFVLYVHLLPALLAGLLVYELVHQGGALLDSRLSSQRAKLLVVALLAFTIAGAVVAAAVGIAAFLRDENSLAALAAKMAEILEKSRGSMPESILAMLPESVSDAKDAAVAWLRDHSQSLQGYGKEAGVGAAHILVGVVIGAMVAMREVAHTATTAPLTVALAERCGRFADAFRRIVFAQIRISALNTVITAAYILVALPLMGIHLPLAKTMVAVTFLAGLLPVIGNLISNIVIVVLSLAHSPQVAVASLVYLVVIHKLEYFLNARIVGSRIQAQAWELLLAMLAMEAAFGIAGVVAAPIYYAYVKRELTDVGLA